MEFHRVLYILFVSETTKRRTICASGSVVEYRLAKARVAGSNPVSCSQRERKGYPRGYPFFVLFESNPGLEVRSIRQLAAV